MGIENWSTAAASNILHFPENQSPASVNNGARDEEVSIRQWYNDPSWVEIGKGSGAGDGVTANYVIAYIGATQFSIVTDVTAYYNVGRKIRATVDAGAYLFGVISAVSYSAPDTTVTVSWLSTTLTSGTLRVWLGADSGDSDTTSLSGSALDGQSVSPKFKGPTETVQAIAIFSNTVTFTVANGQWVQVTLNANISTWAVTWPAGASSFFLELTQDGTGGRTVAWPAAWLWPAGNEPTMTSAASSRDLFAVASPDGGTTVFANSAGQAYA